MRVSSRLLLSLLPIVAGIMSAYAVWALRERETTMVREAQRETVAYATALGLAFEYGPRDAGREHTQEIINQVSREPTVYGILVYDGTGRRTFASDTLATPGSVGEAQLREVLASGRTVTLEREIDDQRVYSVVRPLRASDGTVTGAVEVAQPLARVEAEKARVRRRFLLNTVTLLAALTLVTLFLVRRTVGTPMQRLVGAVRAVGRGELGYRLGPQVGGGEIADLAREFDGMATSLEAARTDLLRQAEERVALERRLRESEKLATVGTLATGLAHEIAAPLNVISGRAEMLLGRDAAPEARERHLRSIVVQIGRITAIVDNLLNYARRRETRMVRLDVGPVIDGVAEFLGHELQRSGVRYERDDHGSAMVRGDPDLLHQVFMNLFLNAVQAMGESRGEKRISVRVRRGGNGSGGVVVDVEDTGPGIAPTLRDQVFQPFFTTRPAGTGLGLALARGMVEEQGGRLEVAEPDAHGALFRVTLSSAEGDGG